MKRARRARRTISNDEQKRRYSAAMRERHDYAKVIPLGIERMRRRGRAA